MRLTLLIIFLLLKVSITGFSQKATGYIPAAAAVFDAMNGQPFAEIALEDTAGNIINTLSFYGKTVYVDFWFTSCPPCIKEIPFTSSLQTFFAADSNIVFLSICIEDKERKQTWKQLIREKQLKGVHLFYARNQPQKINLLRKYNITFPTYLLVNNQMKIAGYDAPRPSEKGFVHWAIKIVQEGKFLSEAYKQMVNNSSEYRNFISQHQSTF